ncbi:MAG: RDD family protein [Helicobacter sp.]|nr:RDD family protein [Helicobacter sp.]
MQNEPLEYAGFWIRLLATVIDFIILFSVVTIGTITIITISDSYDSGSTPAFLFFLDCPIIFWLIVIIAVTIAFWHGFGATPGKIICKIKIVNATTHETIGFWRSIWRLIGYCVSATFAYLGFIWIAFDPKGQGWHDKMANTVVIKVRRKKTKNQ